MKILIPLLLSLALLLLSACGEDRSETQATEGADLADSLTVEVPAPNYPAPAPQVAPDLLGTWQLEEMWIDGNMMSAAEIGTSYLEFTAEGQVTSLAPGFDPVSSTFSYEEPLILAEALEGQKEILELEADRLVLLESVDNTEVKYVYQKKN